MTRLEQLVRRLRRRFPSPLRRIFLETGALLVVHFALVHILARVHLLEHLLAPGPGSKFALVVTTVFLVLRLFLLIFAPGWFLARLWLFASRPRPPQYDY